MNGHFYFSNWRFYNRWCRIRVAYDGTTADTAGNAVREQISELKSDLGESHSQLISIENFLGEETDNLYNKKSGIWKDNWHYYLTKADYMK